MWGHQTHARPSRGAPLVRSYPLGSLACSEPQAWGSSLLSVASSDLCGLQSPMCNLGSIPPALQDCWNEMHKHALAALHTPFPSGRDSARDELQGAKLKWWVTRCKAWCSLLFLGTGSETGGRWMCVTGGRRWACIKVLGPNLTSEPARKAGVKRDGGVAWRWAFGDPGIWGQRHRWRALGHSSGCGFDDSRFGWNWQNPNACEHCLNHWFSALTAQRLN